MTAPEPLPAHAAWLNALATTLATTTTDDDTEETP